METKSYEITVRTESGSYSSFIEENCKNINEAIKRQNYLCKKTKFEIINVKRVENENTKMENILQK